MAGGRPGGVTRVRTALVFVQIGEGKYEPRLVRLGASNYDFSEVISGLHEGDKVASLAVAALQAKRDQANDRMRSMQGGVPGVQQQHRAVADPVAVVHRRRWRRTRTRRGLMLYAEVFRVALGALRANKLRSLLTMLGIVIGVGAVIAMDGIGRGAQTADQVAYHGAWHDPADRAGGPGARHGWHRIRRRSRQDDDVRRAGAGGAGDVGRRPCSRR